MNILVFSTVFHPAVGGLENQTLILIREFIKLGHSVKVITDQKQYAPLNEFEVYDTPNFIQKIKLFLWCNAYYMPNISLKGVWLLLLNPKKNWIISHNDFYLYDQRSVVIRLKRFLIKFASKNIAVSSSVAGYINTSSTVIYNCYDESTFKLYPEENRCFDFVFLGRLVSQKGCDILLKACAELQQPFTLNIIGEGPEEEYLKQIVADNKLEKQVQFLGTIRGEELARTLNRHKVMIVPSSGSEGFGIVVLEGMACGCKIVASNAAGLVEAVGPHGEIFKMNDEKHLSQLLKKSLEIETSQQVISDDLKHYLESHTKSIVSKEYLSAFDA